MTIRKNQEKIDKVNFEIFPVYIADVLKKMHKMQAESLEDYSLSAIHAPYMTTLAAHAEGLTMAELSKILKLDKANTSRAMNELLDKGFAEKAEDKKKKSVLRLTESGLAAAADGRVDRIILTGGLAHSRYVTGYLTQKLSFIAPVEVMAGEFELEALAAGASRVLNGQEQPRRFADIPQA